MQPTKKVKIRLQFSHWWYLIKNFFHIPDFFVQMNLQHSKLRAQVKILKIVNPIFEIFLKKIWKNSIFS